MNRQPAGSSKGGQFAADLRGKTPPPAEPLSVPPRSTSNAAVDPHADATAYQSALNRRFALPLSTDLRNIVEQALADSPWADRKIDAGQATFTANEAGFVAAALNHRLITWPQGTSQGPEAAVVRSLYMRFSQAAQGDGPYSRP